MATVTVNVEANTGDATKDINNLDNALGGANNAAENLSSSLEKQEARIKTLGGAINIVGGSVELLAGSLAVSGALSEEQAEQFQTAAIGAIAFADGAKRVFEGYKELQEGITAYGGAAKLARTAQAALNKTILANPYVAFAAAVVAVTIAVVALVNSQNNEEEQLERLEIARERYNRQLATTEANNISLAKAQGQSAVEISKLELEAAQRRADEASKAFVDAKIANQFSEETAEARLASIDADEKLAIQQALTTRAIQDEELKRTEAAKASAKEIADARKTEIEDNFEFYLTMLGLGAEVQKAALEQFTADLDKQNEETFAATSKAMEDRMKASVNMITTTGEEAGKSTAQVASDTLFANAELAENVVGDSLSAFGSLFTSLAEVTGEGNEEAFEKGKKFKIAEVVTSSIQAAFQAFGAAQQFGPILGPILGAAQVAAIAVASNKAIGDIRSSTFGGGTSPNLSSIGGGGASASAGFAAGLGGGSQTLVTNIAPPEPGPLRAYVVTGDVSNGIEAEAQLERRRTFGPG